MSAAEKIAAEDFLSVGKAVYPVELRNSRNKPLPPALMQVQGKENI